MHHPTGLLMLWGNGIRPGVTIANTDNLDIAPTLLALMGVPVPAIMPGRVLSEAWSDAPAAHLNGEPRHASA
jgi:arylsulfatase A-like enzyme